MSKIAKTKEDISMTKTVKSKPNGEMKKKTPKAAPPPIEVVQAPILELYVAPSNGKTKARQISVKLGEQEFPDVINPFKSSSRDGFVDRLRKKCQEWNLNENILDGIEDLLVQKAKEADKEAELSAKKILNGKPEDPSAKALADTPSDVIEAAETFLENPSLIEELIEDKEKRGIVGETELFLIAYLLGTSRLLDDPLGATVKSASSSGKSFVTEAVTSLFPEEDVLLATDITENALYYMPPGSLKHMFVVVGERKHASGQDDASNANATRALRELRSSGRLRKLVPLKSEAGTIETQVITQEGPIAYLDTTTQEVFEEDATRSLSLTTDESTEQTAAIMTRQAQQAAWATASLDEQEAIRRKHQTAQRLLKARNVRIPYAKLLILPSKKLVARRAFPQLLGAIKTIALLRQFQKKTHKDGHIDADSTDYKIAYRLMVPVLRRSFAPLSESALKLLGAIRVNTTPSQVFSRADCSEWGGVGPTEVTNRINPLVEAGAVEQITGGGKGTRYTYKLLNTTQAKFPTLDDLITPDELHKQLKKEGKEKKTKKEGKEKETKEVGKKAPVLAQPSELDELENNFDPDSVNKDQDDDYDDDPD